MIETLVYVYYVQNILNVNFHRELMKIGILPFFYLFILFFMCLGKRLHPAELFGATKHALPPNTKPPPLS